MLPAEVLNEVARQVSACEKCALHFSRKLSVPGEGPSNAEILLIGEGPGFYENEQGRPFVGAAGKFLDELLQRAGVSRREVFITNVVKCRPPGNRDPLPEELAACGAYLERQIEALHPKAIVTLGRFSMAGFLPNARISEVHGQARWVRGRLVIAMFHPAAALHQPSLKAAVEKDFEHLPELLRQAFQPGKPAAVPPGGPPPSAGQPDLLSMLNTPESAPPETPPDPNQDPPDQDPPVSGPPVQLNLF